jgi:hypothetical protein
VAFLTGRSTFLRFRVDGPSTQGFDESYIERLAAAAAGQQRIASADGVEVGWAAGEHVLDTEFSLLKNVVGDVLAFDLRVDVDKLPGDLMRAYYAVELKALTAGNPSGFPSAKQKREARENARDRLEAESKDGRFKKRKCVPVLWDAAANEVLFGTASFTQVDRLVSLFQKSFGYGLDAMTAGRRAFHLAELHQRTRTVDDSSPSAFVPGVTPGELAWIADDSSRDFLGNEFLMWLWFNSEGDSETVKVADGSEVTYMIARSLTLECPRGQTGHETITHEGPSRLPEAKRAIESGKLPRKLGLTLVRHDQQYELSLQAETLAVGAAKFPNPEDEGLDANGKRFARVGQLRHLIETLDLLYDAFGQQRFGKGWEDILPRMQRWLTRHEERRAA